MEVAGAAMRAAGVGAIYLVHGTFLGNDAMGIIAELARVLPKAGNAARRLIRQLVDSVAGDVGNYSKAFARLMETTLNGPFEPRIPVRLFEWSSENHHLGRADGAVRFIDELASLEREDGSRALLWGHSHAGNVFALATNLLGGPREAVDDFFAAACVYYRWPLFGWIDIPVWARVRDYLRDRGWPLDRRPLDFVTFGTPVRYGWESAGYSNLLNFIHHRPAEGTPEDRAPFPPSLHRVLRAADGDYVQQLGIAGTNVMPSMLSWRAWLADRRLHRLLQSRSMEESFLQRIRAGTIVPDEGLTLLVDYGPMPGGVTKHLAGHAVYTTKQWMLFHTEEVVRRFYAPSGD